MSLETRVQQAGRDLGRIAGRLNALGYVFDDPAAVLPGVERGTDSVIARIEREIGPLPLAIKLFWQHVGSVNLTGRHPDWEGCEYPDPLVVYPPSVSVAELDDFLDDYAERMRCQYPYAVIISPDPLHKENVSGGPAYTVDVPATADDPPLNGERHRTTLLTYIELAIRWGGFPALDRAGDHTWPVAELVR